MKRLIALFATPLSLLFPKLAYAEHGGDHLDLCPEGQFDAFCALSAGNIGGIIGTLIIIIFIVAIIIALIWLVIGGIKWITSSGDSAKVEAARNQIIAAVIGLVIVFLSFFILNFVLGIFGLGLGNIEIPKLPGF